MDSVAEIKMRLPIEQLVGQYCQLQKKGRNFVCLCPFHNDSRPSFLVSPDKGIAYCFACRSGGDIFSFYQKIEGCDFPQAIKELADKAGVKLQAHPSMGAGMKKDEKDRVRECLQAALHLYQDRLQSSALAKEYLRTRGIPAEQIEQFQIGVAPDSFSETYEHLLNKGFSRKEILAAGLGVQKELQEERIYDRFRNRLMFPIHDQQGNVIGFGGRTLGNDDAKYINSSDGILFHKSGVLYGLHHAKDSLREKGKAVLVEGYFDVLACHRVGATNAVATCGTALTEQHVKLLKRYADAVTLCLDSDTAGQDAMERAFIALAAHGVLTQAVLLPDKDPADTAQSDAKLLAHLLDKGASPYLALVLERFRALDLSNALTRRQSLQKLLTLLSAVQSSVERRDYLERAAEVFQTTETALEKDMEAAANAIPRPADAAGVPRTDDLFSAVEITLGLFLLHPTLRNLLSELIEPVEPFPAALFAALKNSQGEGALPTEHQERAALLQLYCEHHGFQDWSESLAAREIRRNARQANRDSLRVKQEQITRDLVAASREGNVAEQAKLQNQYQQVLRLMKMAS